MSSKLTPEQQEQVFPTRWTSTDPGGDPRHTAYMYRAKDDQPAPIVGQRSTATVDGVEAAVPHLPYEKWIKPCGTVAAIPMYSSRQVDPGVDWRTSRYYRDTERDLLRSGHVHYETGRPYHYENRADWVAKRESFIEERRAKQTASMLTVEQKHRDEAQTKMAQTAEQFVGFLNEAQKRASEKAARNRDGGK